MKTIFSILVLLNAVSVHSQLVFSFVKIADTSTPIPGGTGNFLSFSIPAYNGSSVVFMANNGLQAGIYKSTGGVLTRVMDRNTPVPGGAGGTFQNIGVPSARGTNVVFEADAASGVVLTDQGIYRGDGGALEILAHKGTPIPSGTGNFTAFDTAPSASGPLAVFGAGGPGEAGVYAGNIGALVRVANLSTPVPSGTGNFNGWSSATVDGNIVAVRGLGPSSQEGIYVGPVGSLIRVADKSTAIPSGNGMFTSFGNPCISGSNVAFRGTGTNGQSGIYSDVGGTLFRVVDTNTTIPGGFGKFTAFNSSYPAPSLDAENVAFVGGSVAFSQQGIYLYTHTNGVLTTIIDKNSTLGGKSVAQVSLHSEGLSGGSIAFWVRFTDNTSGIWMAVLPTPFIPTLSIQPVPPVSVRLLWPTNDPAFNLQFNTNLTTTNWSSAAPSPVVIGTNNVVTNAAAGTQKFYRLFKP